MITRPWCSINHLTNRNASHRAGFATLTAIAIQFLVAALSLFIVGELLAQDFERTFDPRKVIDPQSAITNFPVRTVKQVGRDLNPSELVLGVTVGKEARAYPINMLTGPRREILNDTLAGRAIAATW